MFAYSQRTGILTRNGIAISAGYSGRGIGVGVNNPDMQHVPMVGPCPRGRYTISSPHTDPKLGPVAMRLVPDAANEMFGRAGFFIHGDNHEFDHTASEGCLIFNHETRTGIAAAVAQGDNQLQITE
jgi:hypothetical protein